MPRIEYQPLSAQKAMALASGKITCCNSSMMAMGRAMSHGIVFAERPKVYKVETSILDNDVRRAGRL